MTSKRKKLESETKSIEETITAFCPDYPREFIKLKSDAPSELISLKKYYKVMNEKCAPRKTCTFEPWILTSKEIGRGKSSPPIREACNTRNAEDCKYVYKLVEKNPKFSKTMDLNFPELLGKVPKTP